MELTIKEASESDELLDWIDQASYEDLLRKWRFAPVADLLFVGAVGVHFVKVFEGKKKSLPSNVQVAISKKVGWS